jgi:hypothetical protein
VCIDNRWQWRQGQQLVSRLAATAAARSDTFRHPPHPHSSLLSASATCLSAQGTQSGNNAFKAPAIQTYCKQQCSKCVAAANDKKQCPNSNSALPSACSQGLAFNAQVKEIMDKCAGMYMKDPSSLRKVPGC